MSQINVNMKYKNVYKYLRKSEEYYSAHLGAINTAAEMCVYSFMKEKFILTDHCP